MLFGDERAHVAGTSTVTDNQAAHSLRDFFDERIGDGLDRDDNRDRHAALTRRTKSRVDRRVRHEVEVGVGQNEHVVLCSTECLDALAVLGAGLVHVLSDGRRPDERDRVNAGVGQQTVNGFLVTVEHSEDTVGKTGFLPQLAEPNGGRRVLLGRLEDNGVSRRDGDGEEPHRHHRGEVEGRNNSNDAEWLTNRIHVDTG